MQNDFLFQSPGDIAFSIMGFPVYFYGLIMAFAIFVGFLVAYNLYKSFYEPQNAKYVTEISPYLIITGVLGARLYYCVVNFSYYVSNPFEILNIRQGGLSVHGMIIFGLLSLYWFSKKYDLSFKKLADVFFCASALAQSIGRWGNFFNSEAFGYPTNLPWKLYIPISRRPLEYLNDEFFHPTFLYESILDLTIFIVLILNFKNLSKTPGKVALLYLILYSVVRIFVESFRVDSILNLGGIPVAQVISAIIIIISSCLFFKSYKS